MGSRLRVTMECKRRAGRSDGRCSIWSDGGAQRHGLWRDLPHASVAKELLDGANVVPVLEEVGGKGVP
jgi:hypothetical protein